MKTIFPSMLANISEALLSDKWVGGATWTQRCEKLIHDQIGVDCGFLAALLTPSCTSALEMACILADVGPGDEVIMPSFGFSSAANAVVLRGGVPVFVDIRTDTLNIDETLIEEAVTEKTKAIMVVHYAGVCCEMGKIWQVRHGMGKLLLIEDAAQAYLSTWGNEMAGTLGDMAAFSFHDTKNLRMGEGGALVTPVPLLAKRAEIIQEKGTNRGAFLRGEEDKYTWVDVGLSAVPSEFQAAVLAAQLKAAEEITAKRIGMWNHYHECLEGLEQRGLLKRPFVPGNCGHNAHIYRVILPTNKIRDEVLYGLREMGVKATFHFVPLHSAPAGLKYGRVHGSMERTDAMSSRLLRLPLNWTTTKASVEEVCDKLEKLL